MSFVVDDHGVMFWSGSKEGVGGTGTENKGGKVRGMGWLLGLIVGTFFSVRDTHDHFIFCLASL